MDGENNGKTSMNKWYTYFWKHPYGKHPISLQGFIYVRWVFAGFLPSTVSLECVVGKKSDLLWGLNQLMENGWFGLVVWDSNRGTPK